MNRKALVFLYLTLGLATGSNYAVGQDSSSKIESDLKNCMENHAKGSTTDSRECMGLAYKRMDNRLNCVYRILMKRLSPERRAVLRDSERKWLQYKESELKLIDLFNPFAGGSGSTAAMFSGTEAYAMVKDRVEILENYLEDLEPN